MKPYVLEREQLIRRPLSEIFAFFEDPENLARITPEDLGFVIMTPRPITMQTGTVIDYTIRIFGLRQFWTTLITDYDPPNKFADVQLKGPYRLWHHTHMFEETGEGTIVRDRVVYVLPFGILGRMAHSLVVRRQLSKIFDYRHQVIEQLFGTNETVQSGQPADRSRPV